MRSENPTWDEQIESLFTEPYWISTEKRASTSGRWLGCMSFMQLNLDDYEVVKTWSVTIFDHLVSRSMPLTNNPDEYWPEDALTLFRLWVNQGWRKTVNDPYDHSTRIALPEVVVEKPLRIRADINTLSKEELNTYRMKLDDIGIQSECPNSIWQKLAYIHTDWCLHYQESFLLWHRAFLLHFEELIDFPVPYWNWSSPKASKDGSLEAGLPQAFLDETYIHPKTGEQRLNPLRYAIAKDGKSKACHMSTHPTIDLSCKYVQRDPVLYTTGDDYRKEREEKVGKFDLYQRQVVNALMWPVFSVPEGSPGMPWTNIPSFDPAPPNTDYTKRCSFDGIYEQPHDNVHGWVGPDMADNAYTAFDPVFWSHHSNIDRIFENWKRERATTMFSSNFPLHPFVGKLAKTKSFTDPRTYVYSTIGDMARDARALGYSYQRPHGGDISRVDYQEYAEHLWIVFEGVRCTHDSYSLDLFINSSTPSPDDATLNNKHYIGQILRLGMGTITNTNRCVVKGVNRIIDASFTANELSLNRHSAVTIDLIVTDVTTGKILPPDEYEKLPGFIPRAQWGPSLSSIHTATANDEQGNCASCFSD